MKKIYSILFLLVLFISVSSLKLHAQSKSDMNNTLRISVSDSINKEKILGASCQIKSLGIYTATDASGLAVMTRVPSGKFVLEVSYIGYESYRKEINVSSNKDIQILMQETSLQLKEVNVVAKNSAAGASTSSFIGRQAIDHLQATSLADLTQLLPGER